MAYLGNDLQVAYPSYTNIDDISGSFNSSATSFPLRVNGVAPVPPPLNSQQCLISVGGVVQRPDDSGSEGFRLSGGNIIFASAPATGADFFGVILAGADYVNAGGAFPAGSGSVPSITFAGDTDTGFFNYAPNEIGFGTGGVHHLTLTTAGQLAHNSGSAAAPSYSFTGDLNTGIYRPGADQVAISTGGTGRLFVNSDGTVSVGNALTPAGVTSLGLRVSSDTGVGQLLVLNKSNNATNAANITLNKSRGSAASPSAVLAGDTAGSVYANAYDGSTHLAIAGVQYSVESITGANDISGLLTFHTRPSGAGAATQERLRITSDGRLGLGTSVASAGLTVALGNNSVPAAGATGAAALFGNSVSAQTYGLILGAATTGAGYIQAQRADGTATTYDLHLQPNGGRVGVGTTSPTRLLHVYGTGTTVLSIESNNGSTPTALLLSTDGTQTNIFSRAGDASSTAVPLRFLGGSQEMARFDVLGRFLLGTSSARATYYGAGISAGINVESAGSLSSPNRAISVVNGYSATADGDAIVYIGRTRSDSLGGTTIVQSQDQLGRIAFVGSDGTNMLAAAHIRAEVDGTPGANDMPGRLIFSTTADGASSPTERCRLDNGGRFTFQRGGYSGNPGYSHAGVSINDVASGTLFATRDASIPVFFNRLTDDGDIVQFAQDTIVEGSISVSGTTVSYNGAHLSRWSQLPGGVERTEILRGTVLSNIDEMCEWGDEKNEQLNRMKVSDVEGDKNVSGVFQAWDDDDDTYTNDFYCAMTGDFIIRIAQGVTVERGDLLMSAGDGTAKPQGDGYVQDKTIAKVTSINVSCTYDDGSYCVPCVLMAC